MYKHRHRWKHYGFQGDNLIFQCSGPECSAEYERKMTPAEKKFERANYNVLTFLRKKPSIHSIFHEFEKRFCPERKWKWIGHALMDKIRKWAKKYPEDVQILRCDDSYHAGSMILLIEHRTENEYHGTTVIGIPQCTGEPPLHLFLYPNHRTALLQALSKIGKQSRPIKQRQAAESKARGKAWRELVTLPPSDTKPTRLG